MKNLLYKELKLALHPTTYLFLGLSALLLIPNYPYYITFFYTTLGIFFLCLNGRENRDIYYSMLLPIRKREIVKARFVTVVIVELLQILLAVPFAVLRNNFYPEGNAAGIDPNLTFFGVAFLLLGVFNFAFFSVYYKNTDKVGIPFVFGCTAFVLLMLIAEATVFAVPFVRDCLAAKDPLFLPYKLIVLAIGVLIFLLLTVLGYYKSVKSFESLDL